MSQLNLNEVKTRGISVLFESFESIKGDICVKDCLTCSSIYMKYVCHHEPRNFFTDEKCVKTSCSNESLRNALQGRLQNLFNADDWYMVLLLDGSSLIILSPTSYFHTQQTAVGPCGRTRPRIFDVIPETLNGEIHGGVKSCHLQPLFITSVSQCLER